MISTIIANRLKCVLEDTINEAKTTFISGQNISDNIFLAQELLQGYCLDKGSP